MALVEYVLRFNAISEWNEEYFSSIVFISTHYLHTHTHISPSLVSRFFHARVQRVNA